MAGGCDGENEGVYFSVVEVDVGAFAVDGLECDVERAAVKGLVDADESAVVEVDEYLCRGRGLVHVRGPFRVKGLDSLGERPAK